MLRSQTFSDPEKVKLSESKSMSADLVTTNVWKPISHHARWRLYIMHVYYDCNCIYRLYILYIILNIYIWVFPKIGVPQNGWCIVENPIKMDDLGVPLFLETSIYVTDTNTHHPQACLHVMQGSVIKLILSEWITNRLLHAVFDSPVRQAQNHYTSQRSKIEQNKMAQTVSSRWNILGTCNRTIWNHLEHTATYVVV